MKIAVFGATGHVGGVLLDRLLTHGHTVHALVRDKSKLQGIDGICITEGNVLDPVAVQRCVAGSKAVYVLLGTKGNIKTTIYSSGTENIIQAMKACGIKRIICLSSAGVLGYDAWFFGRIIVPLTLWRPFRDKRKQLELLSATDLDWTIVRPTEIKDKPGGDVVVTYDKMKKAGISVAAVADFLYDELYREENIHEMPIIGDQ
ncbi:NAD(P)-dependent oxidoreductase [Chitinophagaceae bacterium MMS25-I14]